MKKSAVIIMRVLAIILIVLALLVLIADTTVGIIALIIGAALLVCSIILGKKVKALKNADPAPKGKKPEFRAPFEVDISGYTQTADYSLQILATVKDLQNFRKHPYIVFDTETTGLSPSTCEILELSMIKFFPDGRAEEYHSFFNPHCDVPDNITKLTGIRTADLVGAPNADDHAVEIAAFIGTVPVVAHNAKFDCDFLCNLFSRNTVFIHLNAIDTVEMARRAFPGLENYKLNTLISALQLSDGPQLHHARDDVICTNKLFIKCLNSLLSEKQKASQARKAKRAAEESERYRLYHNSPLYNVSFVFTGDFSIPRDEMQNITLSTGAVVRNTVTSKTDYLVKGDISNFPEWAVYRKYGTAQDLIEQGCKVQIITEDDFFEMIDHAKEVL